MFQTFRMLEPSGWMFKNSMTYIASKPNFVIKYNKTDIILIVQHILGIHSMLVGFRQFSQRGNPNII